MSTLSEQLLEFYFDRLPEKEAAALRVRIEREPDVAALFEEIRQSAPPSEKTVDADDEKSTIGPPPDIPDELRSGFFSSLELHAPETGRPRPSIARQERSVPEKNPDDSGEAPALPRLPQAGLWSPFGRIFSRKYHVLSRYLVVFLFLFAILGYLGYFFEQLSRSHFEKNLLRLQAAVPSVLARNGSNTLSVRVTDWAKQPLQSPVCLRLFDNRDGELLVHHEKTDADGNLRLLFEVPNNPTKGIWLEITAGTSPATRMLRTSIPVIEEKMEPREIENDPLDANAEEQPEFPEESGIQLLLDQTRFTLEEPIRFKVRCPTPGIPLLVVVSQGKMPLGEALLESTAFPSTIELPLGKQYTGRMCITLFDGRRNPPQAIDAQTIFRQGEKYLRIEKLEPGSNPPGFRVTDELGKPVAATLCAAFWEGKIPEKGKTAPPVLLDNFEDIRSDYLKIATKKKSFSYNFFERFAVVGIAGNLMLCALTFGFLGFRMLSNPLPLLLAIVFGAISLLLGISLYQDHQLYRSGIQTLLKQPDPEPARNFPASGNEKAESASVCLGEYSKTTDSRGVGQLPPPVSTPLPKTGILRIEATAPDGRSGFAEFAFDGLSAARP